MGDVGTLLALDLRDTAARGTSPSAAVDAKAPSAKEDSGIIGAVGELFGFGEKEKTATAPPPREERNKKASVQGAPGVPAVAKKKQ